MKSNEINRVLIDIKNMISTNILKSITKYLGIKKIIAETLETLNKIIVS